MVMIQFTGHRTAVRVSDESRALARAASAALAARSVLDGRHWRWLIDGPVLQLRATHPDDRAARRRALLCCGVALHHATTALSADGVRVDVDRLPDVADPGLVAALAHRGTTEPTARDARMFRAIAARPSDHRPFADTPVSPTALSRLRWAAESAGACLRVAPRAYGVGWREAVVCAAGDRPEDWLRAGEAVSAVLLAATADGLTTSLAGDQAARLPYPEPAADGIPAFTLRFGTPAFGTRPAPVA